MRNKWLIGGLIASLVVNLVLIGFVIGRMSGAPPTAHGPDPTMGYMRLLRELPEARRQEIMPVFRAHMGDVRREMRSTRADREALFDAISAEPFDAAALTATLAAMQQRLATVQTHSHAAFVDVVSRLDASERRLLADAMRRPPRHRREH